MPNVVIRGRFAVLRTQGIQNESRPICAAGLQTRGRVGRMRQRVIEIKLEAVLVTFTDAQGSCMVVGCTDRAGGRERRILRMEEHIGRGTQIVRSEEHTSE